MSNTYKDGIILTFHTIRISQILSAPILPKCLKISYVQKFDDSSKGKPLKKLLVGVSETSCLS